MVWLASQMWLLLIIAFAMGLGVGWWAWSGGGRKSTGSDNAAEISGTLGADLSAREPVLYDSPSHGPKDDLTEIIGVDEAMQNRLNAIGVFYLRQVAEWGPARVRWIEERLGEPGLIEQENWVDQARALSAQAAAE